MRFLLCLTIFALHRCQAVHTMTKPAPHTQYSILPINGEFQLVEGVTRDEVDCVVTSSFKPTFNENGWSQLAVRTNPKYPDLMQAYAAGYIEGVGTKSLIADNWFNTVEDMCNGKTKFCANLKKFLEANLAYMMRMIKENKTSQYWKQIELNLMQLQGMEDAYYGKVMNLTSNLHIKPFGLTLLNINGDIETLEDVLDDTDHRNHDYMIGSGSCSALIKLLGNSELLAAHTTWSGYNTMLRIIKKYELNYRDIKGELIPGHTSSFSSYPGQIFSGDDFYILSSGLTTIETTISNSNQKLWKYVKSDTVLEWLRNLAANQMARSGVEWSSIFAIHNSGTYNNQWMVVDYNKFTPGIEPQPGLLYVLEQLPGLIVYKDVTNVLKRQTYWASYNSPYYPEVFNASGLPALVKKYGPWFTHDRTPRALIFARNHSSVTDIHKMLKLMRYNNFQHDPLSSCNCTPPYSGENAIAARSDLNLAQGEYPLPALSQRNHGATDVKITSSSLHRNYEMIAECGPTHDQQPVFKWSTSPYFNLPHRGMPDSFVFQPIHVKWDQ